METVLLKKMYLLYIFVIKTNVESWMSRLNWGESKIKIIDIRTNLSKKKLSFFKIDVLDPTDPITFTGAPQCTNGLWCLGTSPSLPMSQDTILSPRHSYHVPEMPQQGQSPTPYIYVFSSVHKLCHVQLVIASENCLVGSFSIINFLHTLIRFPGAFSSPVWIITFLSPPIWDASAI